MLIRFNILVLIVLLSACASIDKTDFELDRQNADRFFATGSYQQAFELYQKSAMQGDKFSQYRLAQMHENGFGTETCEFTS